MRTLWIAAVVLFVDQVTKVMVLKTMYRSQSIPLLGDWLKLTFTENPGMAFGIVFGPPGMVTIFSILATFLIVLYLYKVRRGYPPYLASLALILGGATGNIIDRVFYGRLFGYDEFFKGKVVDFIHLDLWRGYIPDAVPFIGGDYMALFPIWNVADMSIVVGVVGILVFQKAFHRSLHRFDAEPSEAGAMTPSPAEHPVPPRYGEDPSDGAAFGDTRRDEDGSVDATVSESEERTVDDPEAPPSVDRPSVDR